MIKKISLIIAVLLAIFGLLYWSAWRDEQLERSASYYQQCITERYHKSPVECKDSNGGEWCECI
jgi:predicted negative regulator of RcsB-dependent stress response